MCLRRHQAVVQPSSRGLGGPAVTVHMHLVLLWFCGLALWVYQKHTSNNSNRGPHTGSAEQSMVELLVERGARELSELQRLSTSTTRPNPSFVSHRTPQGGGWEP